MRENRNDDRLIDRKMAEKTAQSSSGDQTPGGEKTKGKVGPQKKLGLESLWKTSLIGGVAGERRPLTEKTELKWKRIKGSRVGLWARALFNEEDVVLADKREKEKVKKKDKGEKVEAAWLVKAADKVVEPVLKGIRQLTEGSAETGEIYDWVMVEGNAFDMVLGRSEEEKRRGLSPSGLRALQLWTPEGMAQALNAQKSNPQVRGMELRPRSLAVYGYPGEWLLELKGFTVEEGKVQVDDKELSLGYTGARSLRKMFYARLGAALAVYIFTARGEIAGAAGRIYKGKIKELIQGKDNSWWEISRQAALTAGVEWPELPENYLRCDLKELGDWARAASPYLSLEEKAEILMKPKGEAAKKEIRAPKYSKKKLGLAARQWLEMMGAFPDLRRMAEVWKEGGRREEVRGMGWLMAITPEALRYLVQGQLADLRRQIAAIGDEGELRRVQGDIRGRMGVLRDLMGELEEIGAEGVQKKKVELDLGGARRRIEEIKGELGELESQPLREVRGQAEALEEELAQLEGREAALAKKQETVPEEGEEDDDKLAL